MVKAFLPLLINSKGKIVIARSVAGIVPVPFFSTYCDTKAALLSLSRSLRTELEPFGVQVCCTITGRVATTPDTYKNEFPESEYINWSNKAKETNLMILG